MRRLIAVLMFGLLAHTAWAEVATEPTQIRPILLGSKVPEAEVRTVEGKAIPLSGQLAGKPTVLVFYRGGWCPYCNIQLSGLRLVREELTALGWQLIALSSDKPESLRATMDKTPLDYTLLSDASTAAMQAFGIAFRVDDATVAKYQEYGIDLEVASGQDHHVLPVPAVYLIDANGIIQFSYVHPDYRIRMPERALLEAARAIGANQHVRELPKPAQ